MVSRNFESRGLAATLLLVSVIALATGCGGSESRKARHVQQGQQFMAERNYTKARIEFRNALQIDPKDAEVRSMVGFTSEKLGEYDDAVKAYRVALAANEDLVMARARLARIMAVAGLTEEALELLEHGLESAPQSAQLLSVRAVVRGQQSDLPEARKDAERAFTLDPKDPDVVTTLASFKWQDGERTETIALLRKSIESTPDELELHLVLARLLLSLDRPAEAERELVEVVRLDPRRLEYRSLLAQVYVQQGETDQAIETVREAMLANPESIETKLALAQLLVVHRSLDEAEDQLEAFRLGSPKDYALQLAIADFYVRNSRTDLAEDIYRGVIDAAGKQAQGATARTQLAALEVRAGRIEEASKLLGQVLAENPSDADALAARGEIALQRGDAVSAVTDLRVAFGNEPDSVPIAAALAKAYLQSGQMELAEQALRSVVQASPRNVQARLALAQFLLETGRAQQARPVLDQVVADQPDNPLALEGLFRLQLAGQDLEGALRTATILQSLQPGGARGLLMEGQVQQRQGRIDEARRSFERAAKADPAGTDAIATLVGIDLEDKQPDQALRRVRERLAGAPNNAVLLGLQGDALLGLQRPAEAAASYAAAATAAPGWAQAYRGQALAWVTDQKLDRAVAALESGFKATNGSPQIGTELAALYSRLGRGDAAIELAETMLTRDPNNMLAANNLAMLLATHRSDAKSLERAESLSRGFAQSTNANLLDTYGWVLHKRGRNDEALSLLERVVAQAPDVPSFRYHLAKVQIALGHREKALANLQSALATGDGFEESKQTKVALESLR